MAGGGRSWLWLLVTFDGGGVGVGVGAGGNMLAVVGFMVTATSGLEDSERGVATGIVTMTEQVGITMGVAVVSTIATARMLAAGGSTGHSVLSGCRRSLW